MSTLGLTIVILPKFLPPTRYPRSERFDSMASTDSRLSFRDVFCEVADEASDTVGSDEDRGLSEEAKNGSTGSGASNCSMRISRSAIGRIQLISAEPISSRKPSTASLSTSFW